MVLICQHLHWEIYGYMCANIDTYIGKCIYILYCLYMYVYINVCVHFILYYFILCFPFFVPGSADHRVKKQFRRLAE